MHIGSNVSTLCRDNCCGSSLLLLWASLNSQVVSRHSILWSLLICKSMMQVLTVDFLFKAYTAKHIKVDQPSIFHDVIFDKADMHLRR